MSKPTLYINLYWHMHQPDYRDTISGEYVLPWTYLHATKDYTDMAYHLEQNPKAKVTFNFVPVLLDQLEDYASQFQTMRLRDPLLEMLAHKELSSISSDQVELIIESCFKCNFEKMLDPFPNYVRLRNILRYIEVEDNAAHDYLSAQYLADLLVWYHLAWMGESVRRTNLVVQNLMSKGSHFTLEDRLSLFKEIGILIRDLIPRYKKLQDQGRIEISSTPHYHPILPLLLDFKSTRDAMPFAPLPRQANYIGGRARAESHVISAIETHLARFGVRPTGMWPAEGSISHAALSLLAENNIKWAATGEGVLANSLYKSMDGGELPPRDEYLYSPYVVTDGRHDILCFFRDDSLSDKIGFEYSKIHADEAVHDFVASLERIHRDNHSGVPRVVSIILDGENAWEYYPYNGFYFLSQLYEALAIHPHIKMTTFSEIANMVNVKGKLKPSITPKSLPAIAAGSWVYGTFSTWIGSPEKNHAWDLLCLAKKEYDKVMHSHTLSVSEVEACERQLAICEGSDWFWWFGDYNSSVSVQSFDRLYRRNLKNLYHLLKLKSPATLEQPISLGGGDPANAGTMRRGQEN